MNSVNLIGRLTRDPELRETKGGKAVCTMRVAVNGVRDDDTTYIDVVSFDKQAAACAAHLAKGREVAVTGRLSYSEWKADDGTPRSRHEVIGRVQFLSSASGSAATAEQNGEVASEIEEGIVF